MRENVIICKMEERREALLWSSISMSWCVMLRKSFQNIMSNHQQAVPILNRHNAVKFSMKKNENLFLQPWVNRFLHENVYKWLIETQMQIRICWQRNWSKALFDDIHVTVHLWLDWFMYSTTTKANFLAIACARVRSRLNKLHF